MDYGLRQYILAVVTTNKNRVSSGTTPTFYVDNDEEKERMALLISKITMGMVHDLEKETYVIVRH